ncbi:MAG: hypothetical protein N2378_05880 [Chloroflexaceae bacterium]|nr:hypothetical protein [Chloroflexaceae bacterium]
MKNEFHSYLEKIWEQIGDDLTELAWKSLCRDRENIGISLSVIKGRLEVSCFHEDLEKDLAVAKFYDLFKWMVTQCLEPEEIPLVRTELQKCLKLLDRYGT